MPYTLCGSDADIYRIQIVARFPAYAATYPLAQVRAEFRAFGSELPLRKAAKRIEWRISGRSLPLEVPGAGRSPRSLPEN
jgi:hypothetical protein